jgi:hypothetical protein
MAQNESLRMERNWDCVRAILLGLAGLDTNNSALRAIEIRDFNADVVSYHMHIMIQAGLIEGSCSHPLSGSMSCVAFRMTWEGQELLSAMHRKPVWERIKAVATEKGIDLGFDAVKAVGAYVIKDMLK